jgi:glycine cleavage system aminomethyltransferase T
VPAPPTVRSIPASYGRPRAEYDAIRGSCAIDRVAPRLLVAVPADGAANALAVLRRRPFEPGSGAVRAAALLNDEGRLTACVTIIRRHDGTLMLDISNPTGGATLDAAGVETEPHGDEVVRMRLRGPRLAEVLGREAPAAGDLVENHVIGETPVVLCGTGSGRIALYCDRAGARATWDRLVTGGAVPVGGDALETVRIEDAEPCLERDFQTPLPPASAGLGAFAGGTDTARVLVAIEHEGARALERARLLHGGDEVGELRVAANGVERAGRPVALALIDRPLSAPGTPIDVDAGELQLAGVVTNQVALPPGSAAPNY